MRNKLFRLIKFLTIFLLFIFSNYNIAYSEGKVFRDINPISLKNFEIYEKNNVKISTNKIFLKNKYYLINFWATWCVPCKKELPDLTKIYNSLKNNKIKFYIISIDKKKIDEQLKYLKDNNIKELIPFFDTDLKIFNHLQLRGIPTTLLLNKNGYVVKKREGILKNDFKTIQEIKDFVN